MTKKLVIVTDAWEPQVNGVVRTLQTTKKLIEDIHEMDVHIIHPHLWSTLPLPKYPQIQIPINVGNGVAEQIERISPDFIHISVEGTLGIKARNYCKKKQYKYTTAYHTKFPEYLKEHANVPLFIGYAFERWFHKHSSKIMVATPSLEKDLTSRGFTNLVRWVRGVDTNLFHPKYGNDPTFHTMPYALYVGRVSAEKNIEAFLDTPTNGLDKIVVGDGPQLEYLKKKYPKVLFVGEKRGEELAKFYANADVFVFPSTTDTFGLVILEALSCGVPVAGYPVTGPIDIIKEGIGGLNEQLFVAIQQARYTTTSNDCRQYVLNNYTWEVATQQFVDNLVPIV